MRFHKPLSFFVLYICLKVDAAKLGGNDTEVHHVDTIIIGAGISGLAAAGRLVEKKNTDFVVLEAQSRLGGRIFTQPFGGVEVEIGAQWIHGVEGNMVYYIADKLGKIYQGEEKEWKSSFHYSNGKIIPLKVVGSALGYLEEIYEEQINAMKAFEGSVGTFVALKFGEYLEIHNDTDESLLRSLSEWKMKERATYDASETLMKVNTKSYDNYKYCEGNQLTRWNGGYNTLINYLVKDVPEENIQTNCEVTSIDWRDGVSVTCKTGESFHGKRVLITVSLGVLKALPTSFFSPPLPKEKKDVITSLQFGTIDKIYIKFPHRWWPDDITMLGFTWSENEDSYSPEIDALKDSWVRDLYAFIDGYGDSSTMIGWVYGDAARRMEELPEEQVKKDCMKLLRAFMSCYDIPDPTELFRSTWYSNPFFRGSYSSISEVTDDMYLWQYDLARPVKDADGNDVLLFAGEATHTWYYSTAHAALESGWREGDRILRSIKRND